MKKLLLIVLLVFTVAACSPVAQSQATPLPPELVAFVGMLLLVGITYVLKWLGGLIGIDLSDKAAELATVLSSILVLVINWALGLIPAAYDNWVNAIFAFLIILIGGNGFYSLFLRRKDRG